MNLLLGGRLPLLWIAFIASPAFAAQLPVVDILYPRGGSLLDRMCQTDLRLPVDDKAILAAVQQRTEFQKQWDTEGPAYMSTALDGIGLDFPYREVQVTLTVCLGVSTSVPLIVDVRPFLPGATKPDPVWEFSEVVFHELMHTYVSPVFADSALLNKYRDEPPTTKYHLHVMAVEKMTLMKLRRQAQLAVIDHDYRFGPDPAYKRAWEIVNDIEGYKPFIEELQAVKAAAR